MARRKHINRPTFKTKEQAIVHGFITHGETRGGVRKFRMWKTKKGWSVARKPNFEKKK